MAAAISLFFIPPLFAAETGAYFLKSAEWPFSPPSLFLKAGVNAVTSGSDLVFWAVGDTIAVINKDDLVIRSTIYVDTSNAVQDILFDEESKILYVAAGYDEREQRGGLQIFDITNPELPLLVKVYDRSPDNPGARKEYDEDGNVIGSLAVPDIDARSLGLTGTTLFLADDNFGLRIIDVDEPSNPSEIPLATPTADRISGYKQPDTSGSFMATGGYVNLSLYSHEGKIYVFVLDFFYGIKVFDVTDPSAISDPVVKQTLSYIWYGSVSLLSDIFVNETDGHLTAFVTGGDTTENKYVVARIDAPMEGDAPIVNLGRCYTSGEARGVTASGNYAYIADGSGGLSVVDIVNGTEPEGKDILEYSKVGGYSTDVDFSYSVFLDGAVLYLATGESGLNVLNVTVPSNPTLIDQLDSQLSGDDVCVSGNYTYMLDRKRGLRIFDTENTDYPILKSVLLLEGLSLDMVVSGDYAYIAKSTGSVAVIDISDKLSPVLKAVTLASPAPRKLFISGTRLYIADATAGLRIVNVADPLFPAVLGSAAASGPAKSIFVHENRAYVAYSDDDGDSGLDIFNVANPAAPSLITSASMTDARDVWALEADGSVYALVADGTAGLKILDVTDTESPLPASVTVHDMNPDAAITAPFTAVSVAAMEDRVYVGMGPDGVLALDATNPLAPLVLDSESTVSYTSDIVPRIINDTPYITTAERYTGFRILFLKSTSSDTDDDEPFVPTIDAGCFVGTASVTGSDGGWTESVRNLLNRLISI